MEVSLKRGEGFDAAVDEDAATQPVVIIDEDFWNRRLGSDPDILGKTITLNRIPHIVVGIVPDGFHSHMNNDEAPWANLWIPLRQHPRLKADDSLRFNRDIDWVRMHGRLSPGVSIERANAAVSGIMAGLASRTSSWSRGSLSRFGRCAARPCPYSGNGRIGI
jgi:putative ABC transport system permease protein